MVPSHLSAHAPVEENEIQDPHGRPSAQPLLQWLSKEHDALRATPQTLALWGEKLGEVVVRGNRGTIAGINISLYNRGDDGTISVHELHRRWDHWCKQLDLKTNSKGEPYKHSSAVATLAKQWRSGQTAFLLEFSASLSHDPPRAEFLRLRIAPLTHQKAKINHRSSLRSNVQRDRNGDVFIKNMPMVDQGQKGYCAVATIARVTNYYGLDVDQHEIAQWANSSQKGTNIDDMEKSFKTIISRLHIRTTQHFEWTPRQFEADVRAYNQKAKKQNLQTFEAPEGYVLNPATVWMMMDPAIVVEIKSRQSGCKRYMTKVSEYIDQGIPLCWCLRLGLFPEKNLPQQNGGHMRLIIGYNSQTSEIIYSDSWGKGHEFKKMPLSHAYASTSQLYTMSPTR